SEIDTSNQHQVDARDLILFYLYTGARLSEGLTPVFTWANVGQGALHFPHTKMSKSRTIPMPEKVREILESRKHLPEGPFPFTTAVAYSRIKRFFRGIGIQDASPHTLRKTAGSLFYLATRDIFAASRFLGHSSVTVTEQHYQGLIQSLQVENARKFEDVLSRNLLHICYDTTKGHQSPPIDNDAVGSDLPTGKVVLDGIN
ncbi:MAG: site-specific integrase, partial [Candidatus Marinimicrobia bacterium]|nr:site-specific integrase [Candidatus Neomarinimicrobiota bacterium]